ncbi:MAG: sugar nucleotide-binding protein [Pseudomonadales bacterium]|nr:sugar nucleotide-binding protein [Pseudomonadales bacterium]
MKVLLISEQQDLIASVRTQCQQRIESVTQLPVNWRAVGESVDLGHLLRQQQPDFIVCAVMLPIAAEDDDLRHYESVIKLCAAFAKENKTPLVLLSTASVFAPGKLNYNETDSSDSGLAQAKFYLRQEEYLQKHVRQHIILRTSWVYSADENNFLAAVVRSASANTLISFNSAGKGCPTSVHDVARVLIAILLQLDCGAQAWGLYHYASSDAAIGFQFVEAIVAQASQFDANIDARSLHFEHNDAEDSEFYFEPIVLNCQKLLNTFGIHQKPWRALLAEVVKDYFEEVNI